MKHLTTIRLDPEDHAAITMLCKKWHMRMSDVIRETIHSGLTHMLNGQEENALLEARLSKKTKDIDGPTFLASLKKDLKL